MLTDQSVFGCFNARVSETERLADLYAYEILDTDPEEAFDDIVRLAAAICSS